MFSSTQTPCPTSTPTNTSDPNIAPTFIPPSEQITPVAITATPSGEAVGNTLNPCDELSSAELIESTPSNPQSSLLQSVPSTSFVYSAFKSPTYELFTIPETGSPNPQQLTSGSNHKIQPKWSPDGTKIAYVVWQAGTSFYSIYVMNADGSNPRQLTPSNGWRWLPDWSPDGTKIVYIDRSSFVNNIYVMNSDGSGVTQLTNTTSVKSDPDWSPDGTKIAYHAGSTQYNVFVLDLNSTNPPQQLTTGGGTSPAWSPDGTKIAYECLSSEICVMNSNGTSNINISNNPTLDFSITWAPDGSRLAFISRRFDNRREIIITNADGSNVVRVTNTTTDEGEPDWKPFDYPLAGNCQVNIINTGTVGLALRESPTRYSPRLTTIPNNDPVTAIYKIEIQGSGVQKDVWYQVVHSSGLSGFIAARIADQIYASDVNCNLPEPYPSSWKATAQIFGSEIPQSASTCDIATYLRTEQPELVMARVAFGEAAVYKRVSTQIAPGTSQQDHTGGIVFSDALRVSWIIRLDAFLGLPNYGALSKAGISVSFIDMALQPGAYEPVGVLLSELSSNGCNPSAIVAENVRRMVFPQDDENNAELYQLWRVYRNTVGDPSLSYTNGVAKSAWSTIPTDILGYDQFKGVDITATCPSGANGLTRPGSGFYWAANQPYPPKVVYGYIEPQNPPYTRGDDQGRKTCYQDIYHLDDAFFASLNGNTPDLTQQPAGFSSNVFPKVFDAVKLCNPSDPNDIYFLAQLTGQNGQLWPPPPPPGC
jgi:Tol biopolymer transport system component